MYLCLLFILLFICFLPITISRPSRLQEENNSEIEGGEYESDESVDDEYAPEENEPAVDEASEQFSNHDSVIREPEHDDLIQDPKQSQNKHFDNNREVLDKFTEIRMNRGNQEEENISNNNRVERISDAKEHPEYILGINSRVEPERSEVSRTGYRKNRIECRNVDDSSKKLVSDNFGDSLFKRFYDHMRKDKSEYEEDATERSNVRKQNEYRPLQMKDAKNYDYLISDRNRRQIKNGEEKPVTIKNSNIESVNENDVLKNINKLSEQDLEELMNSLSEDKKELLKKIMDKREITKKAGAIDDNNNLDQSETNKIEGSYSVNTNSLTSLLSNVETTETNKHNECGGDLNTKVSDRESETGKLGSKSVERSDTSTIGELLESTNTALKGEENLNINNKENLRSENKREINQKLTNEDTPLENSLKLDSKNSNNYPMNEDISEDEDWLEPKDEDLIAEKSEVSQSDSSDLTASVEKLQDSFPNDNTNGDFELNLEPLIRIKRKELKHRINKRHLPLLPNYNVKLITDFESKGFENEENGEFNYKDSVYKQGLEDADNKFTNKKGLRKKRALNSNDILPKNYLNDIQNGNKSSTMSTKDTENIVSVTNYNRDQYKTDEDSESLLNNIDKL